jgi:hypothetical protein
MTVPHLMNCPHSADGWCLDCVVALGNENWRLREALTLAAPALELGCDALRNEAELYHAALAGYRPHRHQVADDSYIQADIAWQAAVAALGPNRQLGPAPGCANTEAARSF